ncbi:hypothetical protein CRI88_07060 [Lysinibacillus fusiformis]|uniref:Uncharacterized protein n=1 Tax=Lysinibacillus fusiformis TaxID=28031 RepID=A0A2I0V1C7_9BACI|nr:hypothetical protein CRI88_07060 [Lysinibacillus fusiformis]
MCQLGWNRGSLYSSRPLLWQGDGGFFVVRKNCEILLRKGMGSVLGGESAHQNCEPALIKVKTAL